MTATKQPTRKQQQVLDLLDQDKTATQIAKAMGITPNGVHGHIRRMRATGLLNKNGQRKASSNGRAVGAKAPTADQVSALASDALKKIDVRTEQIAARKSEIKSEFARLEAEDLTLDEEATQLQKQRASLANV